MFVRGRCYGLLIGVVAMGVFQGSLLWVVVRGRCYGCLLGVVGMGGC